MEKIKGGYYIKARKIQNSVIATAPPHVREIWDWLIKEANHEDKIVSGQIIKRGSMLRTFADIQEGLHWMVGWRKEKYKKWQCENTMKFLREQAMITTMKTTRGIIICICNYDHYQDPRNYTRTDTIATDPKQTTDTINNKDKKEKKDNNISKDIVASDKRNPELQELIDYATSKGFSLQGSTKINRQYAWNLLRKKHNGSVMGLDRCKWLVEAALSSKSKPYLPTVNDFKQLYYKWQDLIALMGKDKNERDKKVIG